MDAFFQLRRLFCPVVGSEIPCIEVQAQEFANEASHSPLQWEALQTARTGRWKPEDITHVRFYWDLPGPPKLRKMIAQNGHVSYAPLGSRYVDLMGGGVCRLWRPGRFGAIPFDLAVGRVSALPRARDLARRGSPAGRY